MAWGGFLASRDRIGLTCFVTRHNPVSTATIKPIYPILLVINDVSISCYICVGSVVAKCWFPYKIDTTPSVYIQWGVSRIPGFCTERWTPSRRMPPIIYFWSENDNIDSKKRKVMRREGKIYPVTCQICALICTHRFFSTYGIYHGFWQYEVSNGSKW